MNIKENLVPHILCAISSATDQRQTISKIVRFVEDRLEEKGQKINNIEDKIINALRIVSEFGLISAHDNIVRLRFNPNSKPPFGFQAVDDRRDCQRSLQNDKDNDEVKNDEDCHKSRTTIDDNKATCDQNKFSKKSGETTSDYNISPISSENRRRKRKFRTKSKHGRSRSRRGRKTR